MNWDKSNIIPILRKAVKIDILIQDKIKKVRKYVHSTPVNMANYMFVDVCLNVSKCRLNKRHLATTTIFTDQLY